MPPASGGAARTLSVSGGNEHVKSPQITVPFATALPSPIGELGGDYNRQAESCNHNAHAVSPTD